MTDANAPPPTLGMMLTSPTTAKLTEALAKASGAFDDVSKNASNPHLKSKYANLASYLDATRGALSANGLAVVQGGGVMDGSQVVITRLSHASGEWIESHFEMPRLVDAQKFGAYLTYLRRYSYASILSLAPGDEDDDGESIKGAAVARQGRDQPPPRQQRAQTRQNESAPTGSPSNIYWRGQELKRTGIEAWCKGWADIVAKGSAEDVRAAAEDARNVAVSDGLVKAGHETAVSEIQNLIKGKIES